jgi:Peptidase A4 family
MRTLYIRRWWLAVFGLALVLAAGVAAASLSAAQAQADPQVTAIQHVIDQGNAEQAQALSAQNPSLMGDTSTATHLQQMTQINQQLLAQGVSSIQLANVSWGPVSVNGASATATTYEMWVTTFNDSTTMQSTDENDYTLVQQNGSWLISDDQQPNSAASAVSAPQGTTPPADSNATDNNTSRNWAGYLALGNSYTTVSGTWTVPQPSSTSSAGVGATWVGIGGVNSRDLIQAGTQEVASGSGQSQFQAWIEMLPQASQQVPLAVVPGDSVSVSIAEQSSGSGVWDISFKNNTSGKSYQTTVRYNSSESSAEWIEEAPAAGNGIVPLDNFGSVPFSGATAEANGQRIDLSQAQAQPVTMLNATGQPLAVPSTIGSDGTSFSVSRTTASATPVPSGPPSRRNFGG